MTGPDPVMVELAATAASAVNKTDPPDLETGLVMVRVLDSALGELNVQVEIPEALVTEQVV